MMVPLSLPQQDSIARLTRAIGLGDTPTASVRTSTELECRCADHPFRQRAPLADGLARMATVLVSPTTDPRRFWVKTDGQITSPTHPEEIPG